MSKQKQDKWKNRICGYGTESPDKFNLNPNNWRQHPELQQDALSGVLNEIGIVQNVIVNKTTGHLVDGHARVAIAKREGQKEIPVTYVQLSEDEEKTILATLDPLSVLALTDESKLDELLGGINIGNSAINELLEGLRSDKEKSGKELHEELRPYNMTHVLISFPPQKLIQIQKHLENIKNIEGVEVEQASN